MFKRKRCYINWLVYGNAGPPPTPVNVKAVIVGDKPGEDQTVDLTWEMPEAVEAIPADVETEFVVEMKPDSSTRWQPVELSAPLKDTKVMLPAKDLKEYTDYVFRVTAKNRAGPSKPSEPSNKVQTGEHRHICPQAVCCAGVGSPSNNCVSAAVAVFVVGIPLKFVRELPEIVLTEAPEEPTVLECEVTRKPREDVKWLKDGKPLPSRLPSHVTKDEKKGGTVHSLTFDKITDVDLGEYTIQVENIASTGKVDMKGRHCNCTVLTAFEAAFGVFIDNDAMLFVHPLTLLHS